MGILTLGPDKSSTKMRCSGNAGAEPSIQECRTEV
jgi:hypothetical protein